MYHILLTKLSPLSPVTGKSLIFPRYRLLEIFFPLAKGKWGVEKSMNDAFNKYCPCFARAGFAN